MGGKEIYLNCTILYGMVHMCMKQNQKHVCKGKNRNNSQSSETN